MRARLLLALALLAGCRKAPEPPRILQLQTFADLRHKVSFEYPAPWALTRPIPSTLSGPDLGLRFPPSAVVSVNRADEPRLHASDFQAAAFVYAVRTGLSEEACAAVASPATAEVGGTRFHTRATAAAALMHMRNDRVYSILAGPNCFIFDLTLFRFGNGVTRPMTAREVSDVETELTQLLSSVSLQ